MGTDQSEEKLAIILEWGPGRARVVNSLVTGLWGTPGNFGGGGGVAKAFGGLSIAAI